MKPISWIKRVLADTRLPLDTRALLAWLGTRPAGWRYSVDEAVQASGVERKKYQRMLATLKAAGWVVAEHKRDRFGRIKFTKLTLRDAPREGANYTLGRRRPRVPNETLRTEGAICTPTTSFDTTGNPEGGTVQNGFPPTGSQAETFERDFTRTEVSQGSELS